MTFLQRALQALPATASSPLAFAAYVFTVVIGGWLVFHLQQLKTAREGLKNIPDSQKSAYLRTTLNRVVPSSISASDWIKAEKQRYVFYFAIVCAALILSLLVVVFWNAQNVTNSLALPKSTTLVLTESKKGWQTIEGSVHEFTLANPLSGLAIVESIEVEVLDVLEDKWSTTQALVDTYRFSVDLTPDFLGLKKVAGDFKYAPGEVDRISVLLKSKGGFDYFVRFVVTWEDVLKNEKTKTYSDVQIAKFPSVDNPQNLDRNAIGRGSEAHSENLERVRNALSKKPR